jgi:hypothetical protein
MLLTESSQIDPTDVPGRGRGSLLLAARSGLYTLLVLAVTLGAGVFSVRKHGIFNCPASGYSSDRYLAYCGGTNYGDYEHGSFWFGLEPAANDAAAKARVLFLGNSRTQFALSTKATADWFSSLPASYYLLGFLYYENYTFEGPLVRRLRPRPKVYVINIDSFFDQSESAPAKTVMQDQSASTRYEQKRKWQRIHKVICTSSEAACGHGQAIFRSISTGAWLMRGGGFSSIDSGPVSYDEDIDQNMLAAYTALGNEFLPSISADRVCTILTIVPTVNTPVGTAKAIAVALGLNLVAPRPAGLMTFDHSHLNPESAQRWSAAFLDEAGPQIRKCLSE